MKTGADFKTKSQESTEGPNLTTGPPRNGRGASFFRLMWNR